MMRSIILLLVLWLLAGAAIFFHGRSGGALPFDRLVGQLAQPKNPEELVAAMGYYGNVDELAPMQWRIAQPDSPYDTITITKEFDGSMSQMRLVLHLSVPQTLGQLTAHPDAWRGDAPPKPDHPLIIHANPLANLQCSFVAGGTAPVAAQPVQELTCFWHAANALPLIKH